MTHTNQTRNSIGQGIRFEFGAAGDSYYVANGVTVRSTDDATIDGVDGGYRLEVDGLVESLALASVRLLGGNSSMTIGEEGILRSTGVGSPIGHLLVSQGGNEVVNHGVVVANSMTSLLALGNGNFVVNDGLIRGANAVVMRLGDGGRFENSGRIEANVFDDANQNFRGNNGVFCEITDMFVLNRKGGSISAISSEGAGVAMISDGATVMNDGKISSTLWYGVDFFNMDTDDEGRLENSGRISGGAGSFRGNEEADSVVNKGLMKGDVLFSDGDDVLAGSKGKLLGDVDGGDGNDVLRAGAGNQEIDGSTDHDVIDGGKGSDRLRGGLGFDMFFFGTGYGKDQVLDFVAGADLVNLSRWKAIDDFDDVLDHAEKHGANLWIVSGKDVLVLDNVAAGDLEAADFLF